MSPVRTWLPLVAVLFVVSATPVLAQTSLDDPLDIRDARRVERMEKVVRELRAIVFQAQKTGAPVVVQPADTDARMADLSNRISDLEQSLTRLNGSLEAATYELNQSKKRNADLEGQLKTLGDRVAAAEQTAAAALPPPPPPPGEGGFPAAGSGDPAADFGKARQLMLAGDYDQAELAFADFVTAYPDDTRTQEASYWLGKTLTVRGDNNRAASAYIGAIRGWPKTSWAPDAIVELSRSLIALKKPTDACAALGEFTKRYPQAPAAVKTRAAAARTQAKCG